MPKQLIRGHPLVRAHNYLPATKSIDETKGLAVQSYVNVMNIRTSKLTQLVEMDKWTTINTSIGKVLSPELFITSGTKKSPVYYLMQAYTEK